jgi:hypothetical protein
MLRRRCLSTLRPAVTVLALLLGGAGTVRAQRPFISGLAGAAFDLDQATPGAGGGFSLLSQVGLRLRGVVFGAEFGRHLRGGDRKARQYGAFVRVPATVSRWIEPYLTIGLGLYRYAPGSGTRARAIGGSLGPGIAFTLGQARARLLLEGRFHTALDKIGTIASQDFFGIGAGLELGF